MKFSAMQMMERVYPGAIGTLKEQVHIAHFGSPTIGSSLLILEPQQRFYDLLGM